MGSRIGIGIGIGIETGSSLKMPRILVNVLHLTDVSLFHPVTIFIFYFLFLSPPDRSSSADNWRRKPSAHKVKDA